MDGRLKIHVDNKTYAYEYVTLPETDMFILVHKGAEMSVRVTFADMCCVCGFQIKVKENVGCVGVFHCMSQGEISDVELVRHVPVTFQKEVLQARILTHQKTHQPFEGQT